MLLEAIGRILVREDPAEDTDRIVVLSGAFPRGILEAADLYREGRAPKILLMRERQRDGFKELSKQIAIQTLSELQERVLTKLGVPGDAIEITDGESDSTRQETEQVAAYCKKHPDVKSLLIIPRRLQSRRARKIFRKHLKSRVKVISVPSRHDPVRSDNWWKDTWFIYEASMEFLKVLYDVLSTVVPGIAKR